MFTCCRGWRDHAPRMSWRLGFCRRQRLLCVECGQPTRYVFQLLGCRLCDTCEQQSPKYALVTAREASGRFGMPPSEIHKLQPVPSCNTR